MGQRLYARVALLTAMAFPAWAGDQGTVGGSDPGDGVFRKPRGQQHRRISDTDPSGAARLGRTATRSSPPLPKEGELRPRPDELAKIDAARPVLQYHWRADVVTFKVIDVGHAFIGLHARSVLLASRDALSVVSSAEFAALVAHEIGHDYMWQEYRSAMNRKDYKKMQELELRCDGIAVLTLRRVGIDPENLVSAIQKVTRFNQLRDAVASSARYVSLKERVRFIRTIAALEWN